MINKVILVGRLGRDPESRVTPSGAKVTTFTIATNRRWRDGSTGEQREHTEWHRIVCWQRLAEIAAQYLRKGSLVYIEGRLQTRNWTDQNGVNRYTTEIVCENMQMLSRSEIQGDEIEEEYVPPDDGIPF